MPCRQVKPTGCSTTRDSSTTAMRRPRLSSSRTAHARASTLATTAQYRENCGASTISSTRRMPSLLTSMPCLTHVTIPRAVRQPIRRDTIPTTAPYLRSWPTRRQFRQQRLPRHRQRLWMAFTKSPRLRNCSHSQTLSMVWAGSSRMVLLRLSC